MLTKRSLALAATSILACSPAAGPTPVAPPPPSVVASAPSAAPVAPAPETLVADSPRATPDGTTFTAPGGWTFAVDAARRVLQSPERDLRVVVLDGAETTADEAVTRAWAAVDPSFARPLLIAEDHPGRAGWDAHRSYQYQTSPSEHRAFLADAYRHGGAWTVLLAWGTESEFERRGAQVRLVVDTLHPAGYVRESFAGRTPHSLDATRLAALSELLENARVAADVPGLAVGLVQGGKVVFARGFGVRELGKKGDVTADTLFLIGSNTKALTTLLLAREVDDARFTWDTPVTSVFPSFKLGDAETTRQVHMRHLVCACTGIPREDLEEEFEFKRNTPESEVALLATVQPTTKLGEVFQYSNTMAAAAGFIGGYVFEPKKELGAAYDDAMKAKVLTPLGMAATTFDFARAVRRDHAAAHTEDVDRKTIDVGLGVNEMLISERPAGGAWSNVDDMLRYVQMELTKGLLPDGTRYISEDALLMRRAPQIAMDADSKYAMGLIVDTAWGVPMIHHGGGTDGFRSDMFWFPDAGVGGVILTNSASGELLLGPFKRRVAELLFDGHPEAEDDAASTTARYKQEFAAGRDKIVTPADPAAVARLAPHYANASLGRITVRKIKDGVVFDVDDWKSLVATRKNDDGTTSFICLQPSVLGIELLAGEKAGKRTLTTSDAQHEYVFVETP